MTLSLLSRQATGPTVLNEPKAEDLAAPDVIWIDLLDPSRGEEQLVEEAFGIDAPSEAERAALEESARFYLENDVMVLHATVVARAKPDAKAETPTKLPPIAHKREIVSFFLTKTALITVRTCPLRAFEANEGRASADLAEVETGPDVLLALIESLVERVADFLSASAQELEDLNLRVLVSRRTIRLETILKRLGQLGAGASQSRDSLSSLSRLSRFVLAHGPAWSVSKERLNLLVTDVETLQRQAEALTNDLTFFLDATLGLVGARQNETLKAMAVVTLLFAPPTLLASAFGMNFQHMTIFEDPLGPYWAAGLMVASSALIFSIARLGKWI
ncbi:CorA family divalent cation transporter [Aquidulcibacter sp.]|uniref:CorA family divalent cation transporter n=1 Tax=Aquidulcibacter sp. TaxID=2052990 RepID=UPI0028A93CAB|nr:CorA family divalent cation transporter [Aquidulcibacter sp.]